MAYDTVYLTALLHDLGTFYRRAFPQSDPRHAALGRTVFEATLAPRLTGLLDETAIREVAAGIAAHHDNWPFVSEADALASGAASVDAVDEQPAEPAGETLSCPLCRDTTPRAVGAPGRLEWTLLPRTPETADALRPVRSPIIESREADYRRLWEGFAAEAAGLPNAGFPAYCESLTALLEKYASQVPTSRARREPFVSLYDHSVWTAVIASALRRLDGTQATGGEFLLCGARLEPVQSVGSGAGEPARAADRAAAVAGAAFFNDVLLRSIEVRLLSALDLPTACAVLRTADQIAVLAPGTTAARSAFETTAGRLRAAAFDRWGVSRPITFAAVPVDRSQLNRFSLSVAALRRAWDVQARRPVPEVWSRPDAWRPTSRPASDQPLMIRLGTALRGAPVLLLREIADPAGAGSPARAAPTGSASESAPEPAPATGEPETVGPVEFDVLGCGWSLEPETTPAVAGRLRPRRRIALIGPPARSLEFLPPADRAATPTAHVWQWCPSVAAGSALPGRGPTRAVFVLALDGREPDWETADDPPALFGRLSRRLDAFFLRTAAARAADRGGVVISADRYSIAVAAFAHVGFDLLIGLHTELSQFTGARPGLTTSAALTVDRGYRPLDEQLTQTRRAALDASAAGGNAVVLFGERLSWDDFFELRAAADDLLAGPIRERRLRAEVTAEAAWSVGQSTAAEFGERRLPPRLIRVLATAGEEPGLIAALQRKAGRLGPRLPLAAAIAEATLGH